MCVELYRWSIELEGIFVLPLAPRWVPHSYLSKEASIDPRYLWVISVLAPRRVVPRRNPPRRVPTHEERSCYEVPRLQENAPTLPAPPRQDRALLVVAVLGYQDRIPPPHRAPGTTAGCRDFTLELRTIIWPGKFKPDLPPCYDGTPAHKEFL